MFSFILLTINLVGHLLVLSTDYSGQAKKEQIHPQRIFWGQILTYELLVIMLEPSFLFLSRSDNITCIVIIIILFIISINDRPK